MPEKRASSMSIVLRKARTALGLPASVLLLSGTVWVLLWPARLVTLAVPIRYLARLLGTDAGLDAAVADPSRPSARRVQALASAIDLAARYHPLRGTCYAEAVIAHLALSAISVDHAIRFGVRRDGADKAMDAHAWVMAGSIPVCGARNRADYTVVRCFVSAPD